MKNKNIEPKITNAAKKFAIAFGVLIFVVPFIVNSQDLTKPLDENSLFGGSSDIVTTIDTKTASAGTVQLKNDTTTYPLFQISGSAGAGVYGQLVPYTTLTTNPQQSIFGAVNLNGLTFDYLPIKNMHFNTSLTGTFIPGDARLVDMTAYADLRASEFTRLYASGTFTYNQKVTYDPLGTTSQDPTLTLNELFVDTSISRQLFFRIGKQRVSWGVGYWYKPADVLSLAAINPDDPTAARDGPYAVKVDAPFGKLNQATLYVVPPLNGDPSSFGIAGKTDIVVGGFELNLGAFARSDNQAKPRAMFMFTGSVGPFDVYGENVLAYGSDRTYIKPSTPGGYSLYTINDQAVLQSTLGIKYSYADSNGLSMAFHVQGYYNGAGYQDSSILQLAAARNLIKASTNYKTTDLLQAGMYYLAGSASIGGRFGMGEKLTDFTLSAYALSNFSDGSVRFNPSLAVQIGDQGSKLDMTLSDLTTVGNALSEYAPLGNTMTPDLEITILQNIVASVSTPIQFYQDFSFKRVGVNFSLYWQALDFQQ
jgi:hypothetical protein